MQTHSHKTESGFSLMELLLAMAITLVIMGLASTLLASSFKMRSREDRKSDAVSDVQRAFNLMSREIGNAGFKVPSNLSGVSSNGIVAGDSDSQSIRIVSNLNGASGVDTDVTDADEDVKFLMYVDSALGQRYLVRYEKNATNKLRFWPTE
jgi:prepilin-type N-terminal cleavage/methylation domain-containing protein